MVYIYQSWEGEKFVMKIRIILFVLNTIEIVLATTGYSKAIFIKHENSNVILENCEVIYDKRNLGAAMQCLNSRPCLGFIEYQNGTFAVCNEVVNSTEYSKVQVQEIWMRDFGKNPTNADKEVNQTLADVETSTPDEIDETSSTLDRIEETVSTPVPDRIEETASTLDRIEETTSTPDRIKQTSSMLDEIEETASHQFALMFKNSC